MDLTTHPSDPATALHLAELLSLVSGIDAKDAIDERLRNDLGLLPQSHHSASTADMPAWYGGRSGETCVILVAGCEVLSHAHNVIAGYQGALTDPITAPLNTYFRQVADTIYSTCSASGYFAATRFVLGGHSLGGAVAEHLAFALTAIRGADAISLCTFGAPKPGSAAFAAANELGRRARWFGADDPVPLLPPYPGSVPSLLLAFNVFQMQRFQRFVHPAGGIQLGIDGTIGEGILPSAAYVNSAGSLAGWLLAVDGASSSGHHLRSYQSRLAYHLRQYPDPPPQLPELGRAEVPELDSARAFRGQQRAVGNVVADLSRAQHSQPLTIPLAMKFKYHRAGRWHYVTFGQAQIAVSARESTARSLAREGNDLLEALQRSAIVNADELAARLGDYLRKADQPGEGFSPLMNKELPPAGEPEG